MSLELPVEVEKAIEAFFTPQNVATNAIQQHEWELRVLLRKVLDELKPQRTVELGTYKGHTAALLSLVTSLKTMSLDIHDYGTAEALPFGRNLECILLDGTNAYSPYVITHRMAGLVDLLFIDDGHYYEQVVAEFNAWKLVVRRGGWIVFHDINPLANLNREGVQPPECQTTRFWQELQGNKEEIIATGLHTHWKGAIPHGGLGILRI